MQMKIVILEDSKERIKKFKQQFPHADIYETAEECISKLGEIEEPFVLFLDHDLGGEIYVESSHKNTGMEVVRSIETNSTIQGFIFQVIIHSCNIPAALEMKTRLEKIGLFTVQQIPFIEMDF